jgi:hypothetical protein
MPMYQATDFYRHARYLHGWLSALAFVMLMFFAATGLLLNHPQWFHDPGLERSRQMSLSPDLVAQISSLENPSAIILAYLRDHHALIGRYQSSEMLDNEVIIRLQSPAGSTEIWINLETAQAEIFEKPASLVSVLNDLHRGKYVNQLWHTVIDVSAILLLCLSLSGYILFLSIKPRRLSHLVLTAISLVLLMLLIWLAA